MDGDVSFIQSKEAERSYQKRCADSATSVSQIKQIDGLLRLPAFRRRQNLVDMLGLYEVKFSVDDEDNKLRPVRGIHALLDATVRRRPDDVTGACSPLKPE